MSIEVANDSLTAAIALGELQERHDRAVNMKNKINETLDEFIRIIREVICSYFAGSYLLYTTTMEVFTSHDVFCTPAQNNNH